MGSTSSTFAAQRRRRPSRALAGAVVLAALVVPSPAAAVGGQQVTASRQADDVASATAALEDAAAASALALESYRAAAEARREAAAVLSRREADLDARAASADRARAALVRWARTAYVDGGTLGTSPGVYTLFAGGPTDSVATDRTLLGRSGRARAEVLAGLRDALDHRQAALDEARRAADVAQALAARAEGARAARDAALAEQRRRLADLRLLFAGTRSAADRSAADLLAARMSVGVLPADGADGNRVTGPVGECPGGDVSAYGNGRIPPSALCPLAVPAGGLLRADAAYAFDRLAAAYAARFGQPVCVTDSYRSYPDQVRVRAERPGLAAVPGRSNHGWGTATDLCGGIERFDTAPHRWMLLNAPLFGWFHPAWAEPGGTMPEAWHWEFSG